MKYLIERTLSSMSLHIIVEATFWLKISFLNNHVIIRTLISVMLNLGWNKPTAEAPVVF